MALPKPLLPAELCPQTHVDVGDLRAWCRAFLQSLPALNYNTFVYVLSFLREVLSQRSYNRTNPTVLASFCVDTMTSFAPAYRARQQLHCYHTLAGALAYNRSSGSGGGGANLLDTDIAALLAQHCRWYWQ